MSTEAREVIEHHSEAAQAVIVRPANPLDASPVEFRGALARRGENRKSLIEWIREALVDGQDFGKIHTKRKSECRHGNACTPELEPWHWSKPSLRKPGAEKICGMLSVTATFPTIKDYEAAALEGREIHSIVLRCHLLSPDGAVVADGIGARSLAQDSGDLNKALKMACKSAHIDATLRMAGLSEIFTQDLEDMNLGGAAPASDAGASQAPAGKPATERPQSTGGGGNFATAKQVGLVRRRLETAGIPEGDLLMHFNLRSVEQLPFAQVNEALDWIARSAP